MFKKCFKLKLAVSGYIQKMPTNNIDSKLDRIEKLVIGVINGQSVMKSELLTKIDTLDKKLSGRIDSLDKKIDKVENNLTKRIDKIGLDLAKLSDDTPTIEEFDKLEKRVEKVELKIVNC